MPGLWARERRRPGALRRLRAALARVCSACEAPNGAAREIFERLGARLGSNGSRLPRLHQASSTASAHEQRLRLHDVPGRQVLRPEPAGAGQHLAVLPAGRQDRRARPERGRQVDAAAHHGRPRGALERRRRARARRDRGPAGAGAAARPEQGRPRQRGGRGTRRRATCSTASTPSRPPSPSPMRTSTRCSPSRPRCRIRSTAATSGTSTPRSTTPRRPAPAGSRPRRDDALGRRAAAASRSAGCCSRHPTCCCSTSRPTTSTPSPCCGSSASWTVPRHRHGGHARPLLPRQRRRLDPGARPRPRPPVQGQLLVVARAEAGAARRRGEAGVGAPADARARAGVGTHEPEGAPRRSRRRALARTRSCSPRSRAKRSTRVEIHIPAGPRLGDTVVEAERVAKGFGDRLLVEDLTFSLPPGGIVGVIGPNGAGKTTLFRMIAGEEEPDAGELASATPCRSPTSTSRAPTWIPRARSGRRSPAVTTRSSSASAR